MSPDPVPFFAFNQCDWTRSQTAVSHLFNLHPTCRYFNYRTTRFLAEEGFYKFHNWFDDRAWYPLGRIIGGTIYPGGQLRFSNSAAQLDCIRFVLHARFNNEM